MVERNQLKEVLIQELSDLQKMEAYILTQLESLPQGKLHISSSAHDNRKIQYYVVNDREKHYISISDQELSVKLAQKHYLEKMLPDIQKRVKHVKRLIKDYEYSLKDFYYNLSEKRQHLVRQIIEEDDDFIKKWYEGHPSLQNTKGFEKVFYTNRNEMVRSKSEKMIADLFNQYNIPYVYESKLTFKFDGGNCFPDFCLLNVRNRKTYYYEHFGMMDDPKYREIAFNKIEKYIMNGFVPGVNFFFTFESSEHNFNLKVLEKYIKEYLI